MKWKDKLIHDLLEQCNDDKEWKSVIENIIYKHIANIHLAIFNEPFLSMIFSHTKKMESRFSITQVAPYRKVAKGDMVIMKKSGGEIEGFFTAGEVQYFSNLSVGKLNELNERYGNAIGWDIDPDFLTQKRKAIFLSLINIDRVQKCRCFPISKKDRTGWSIVKKGLQNTLFG